MKMKELEDIFGKLRSSVLPKFQNHKKGGLELTGSVGKISEKNAKIAQKCMKMKELEDIFGKLRSSVLPKFQNHKKGVGL